MKVWKGYGSEHSANLVIIGRFKSAEQARKSLDLLNCATEIARDLEGNGLDAGEVTKKWPTSLLDFCRENNFHYFSYGDPEQLLYEFHADRDGKNIVVRTDETDISAILKFLIHGETKIELYSAHDYDTPIS